MKSLNPAVSAMRRYIDLIRPWCIGQWDGNSFRSAEAQKQVQDPCYTVFPIPERDLPGVTEQLLLGDRRARALMMLVAWVRRFNSARVKIDTASTFEKVAIVTMVHGVIGQTGSQTLHDVFEDAERSL